MQKKQLFTVAVPLAAVILAGALIFSSSLAKGSAKDSHSNVAVAQAGPQDDPGMGGPGGGPEMGNFDQGPGMGQPGGMQGRGGQGMRQGMGMPGMGGPGISPVMVVGGEYVYVLRGNTLYQFSAKDLKQVRKVTLPDDGQGMRPQRMPGGGGNFQQRPQ